MTLSAIQTALANWAASVTGLAVHWHEQAGYVDGTWTGVGAPAQGRLDCVLQVLGPIGRRASIKYEYDSHAALGAEIIPHVVIPTRLLWQVRCTSHSQHPSRHAHYTLQRLCGLLHSESRVSATKTVKVGVEELASLVDLTRLLDDRRLSVAQADIRLVAGIDQTDVAYGYVTQFEMESDWTDSHGTSLPATYQIDEVYPP